MEDSIFTKIIKGEIPCHKVYEDDKTLAFVDIYPIQPGMVLVVPKVQVDHLWDLAEEDYQALMATVKKVAGRLRAVFPDKARVGMIVEGFEVSHAHVKIFPINSGDELRALPDTAREPDHAAFAELAKKLAF
jgi:histidine triad (HIT) family protein